MRELDRAGLDNWITGHYGQDQFSKYDPDDRDDDDLCDLCMSSGVRVERTTHCGKTIGIGCGCDATNDGTCGDPGCAECAKGVKDDTDPMDDEPFEKENGV